jgi:autotransporter-associated beta strand protein
VVFDGSAGETLHISGKIGNGSNSSATLTKNGAGTLKLSYDNTYSRAVNVNAGTILIEHEDALGESSNNNANTTTTLASGSTLALNNASAMTVYENLVISGTGASNTGAVDVVDGSHTIAGTVTLAGNSTIDVSSSDDTLTFSQVVSGSSNTLTKTGAGALTLSNNNTYTGNTTVSQGTLNLTGSIDGNLVVAGGTATGGTNSNAVAGALTLSSGTISPNTTGTRGVYNIKGSGTSTWTGGTYVWDVSGGMGSSGTDSDSNGYYEASGASDGTLYDILAFSGALDFNGSSANSITIDVNSYGAYTGYHWETPTEIKIATAASISNFNESFFNIDSSGFNDATGAWWLDWGITSHGNALWLTYNAVPETSTWIMILTLPFLILLKFLHYKKIQKKFPSED